MKLAAAEAIASAVTDKERSRHYIIPSVFNQQVVSGIRDLVIQATIRTGSRAVFQGNTANGYDSMKRGGFVKHQPALKED